MNHYNPAQESPQTPFERFQQCFRNMGVVNSFEEGPSGQNYSGDDVQTLIVRTSARGVNVTNVRHEYGHDFDLIETWANRLDGETEIVHVFEYRGGDDE